MADDLGNVSTRDPPVRDVDVAQEADDRLKKECADEINGLLEKLKNERRPKRVVIIGMQGAGKSSLVNSIAAAVSRKGWQEHAYTTPLRAGEPGTVHSRSFPKCCLGDKEEYKTIPLPTLIDVAGITEAWNESLVMALRLLFYGHLKGDGAFKVAYDFCETHTTEDVLEKYSQAYPDMVVDIVVFVSSANQPIPENAMKCVRKAARPQHDSRWKRSIPIFGVLTKLDLVEGGENNREFQKKRDEFQGILGTPRNRFLACSNYCDDTAPQRKKKLKPSLDLPLLEFLGEICDPVHKPQHGGEKLLSSIWGKAALVSLILGLLAFLFASPVVYASSVLLASKTFEDTVREEFSAKMSVETFGQKVRDLCMASTPGQFPLWVPVSIAAAVVCVCMVEFVFGKVLAGICGLRRRVNVRE